MITVVFIVIHIDFKALSLSFLTSAEGISSGENMDDLYFYRLKNVPLHYNRPMNLPFIQECAPEPYQDVYFFDLNEKGAGNDETMVEAIHAVTFKNTTGQPFTTGPVSVLMAEECDSDDMGGDTPKKKKQRKQFLSSGIDEVYTAKQNRDS